MAPLIQLPLPPASSISPRRVGGVALLANDEFFAEKENLLKPGRGIFIPDKYTDRGKWMDGWESRRRRTPGHDWCVVQLGLRGIIKQVDIDTNHFLGNHPPFASLDAVALTNGFPDDARAVDSASLDADPGEIAVEPGLAESVRRSPATQTWTHVRLNIIPGWRRRAPARLRHCRPGLEQAETGRADRSRAIENGGVPLACSDMFFSSMNNLIMPGRSENMGDGWETKRRRGPGYDWIILKLGSPGTIQKIEVDTNHFKGNYPDTCSIEGCNRARMLRRKSFTSAILAGARFCRRRNCRRTRGIFSRRNSPRLDELHARAPEHLSRRRREPAARRGEHSSTSTLDRVRSRCSDFDLLVRAASKTSESAKERSSRSAKNLSGSAHVGNRRAGSRRFFPA